MIAGAIIGGIAGAAAGGITSFMNAQRMASAYDDLAVAKENYAKDIRKAAEQYSGQNAYNAMQAGADMEGLFTSNRSLNADASQNMTNNSNAMANAADLSGDYLNGYNAGADNQATNLDAKFDSDTAKSAAQVAKANANLQQMGVNVNAANQMIQGGLSTAGGTAKLISDLKTPTSDERAKKGINNQSHLPASDIEDSLRQLETISYKYKNPNIEGCDDETHESGFTAQSLAKTPLNKKLNIVQEGADGIKRVDDWKLKEALLAGLAQMQREIDDLEGK